MDSMLVKRALLIYVFDCFAEIMVIYFAFPALSLAYQVNVAQNLHKQKGTTYRCRYLCCSSLSLFNCICFKAVGEYVACNVIFV